MLGVLNAETIMHSQCRGGKKQAQVLREQNKKQAHINKKEPAQQHKQSNT
jgi:hypothetical protein